MSYMQPVVRKYIDIFQKYCHNVETIGSTSCCNFFLVGRWDLLSIRNTIRVSSIAKGCSASSAAWRERTLKMAAVYEDNFGFWDIDAPEERAFFEFIKDQSACANCERCQRRVRLTPSKTLCATCVSALECGAPISMTGHGYSQTTLLDPRGPPRRAVRPGIWQLRPRRGHRRNERMAAKGVSPG